MKCNGDYCEIERSEATDTVIEPTEPVEYPIQRNLDGAYFRVERNGKWGDVCFSDLTEDERGKQMAGKSVVWLASMCEHLASSLHAFGDAFDITARNDD